MSYKITIRRIYIFTIFIFLFFLFFDAKVIAQEQDNWNIVEKEEKDINGLSYVREYGSFSSSSSNEIDQCVSLLKMKTDGINSKLVNWAVQQYPDGYSRNQLSYIAKDYEQKHPGWIVLGGINGDQYYPKFGSSLTKDGSFYYYNQPYYPMIIDGERRFPITPTGVSSSNFVGINNDGSFVDAGQLSNIKVEIIDSDEKILRSIVAKNINKKANSGEVSVYFPTYSTEKSNEVEPLNVTTSNNLFIVEKAELAYKNNSVEYPSGQDSIFGRGTITSISKNINLGKYQFAIELGENVNFDIKINYRVRVQYYYNNETLNNVESSFGFHSIQRQNNTDVSSTQGYDLANYSRSIFGVTSDGSFALVTIAKGDYSNSEFMKDGKYIGTTQDQSNKILKLFDISEAYQQDGGGSVTAIVRNEDGDFDVVNESSDSGTKERRVLNGCLFVVRDPEFKFSGMDSTRTSITLKKTGNVNDSLLTNLSASIYTIDDKLIETKKINIDEDEITFKNLDSSTSYNVVLRYDLVVDNDIVPTKFTYKVKTNGYIIPPSGVNIEKINGKEIIIAHHPAEYITDKFTEIKIYIKDKKKDWEEAKIYDLPINNQIVIDDLESSKNYDLKVSYEIVDAFDKKEYTNEEFKSFTTGEYFIPEISLFSAERISENGIYINYNVKDLDKLVYKVHILQNGSSVYSSEKISDSFSLENIDILEEQFKLVIQYSTDTTSSHIDKTIKSDIITITKDTNYNILPIGRSKCSCKKNNYIISVLSALSLLAIILFKKD